MKTLMPASVEALIRRETLPEIERPESPEPGVYYDIPEDVYNSWGPELARSSTLAKLLRDDLTPAHVYHEMTAPRGKETDAQVIGRLTHAALLEPERFDREYAFGPDVKLNTQVGKEEWAKVQAANPGKKLIRYNHGQIVRGVVESIWTKPEHEPVRNGLLACDEREVTIIGVDQKTGVRYRARIDLLGRDVFIKGDLKSCESAADRALESAIVKFGYDIQAALYQRACEFVGWDIRDTFWIFYEKSEPYLARVQEFTSGLMQVAQERLDTAFEIYATCLKAGRWPGYPQKTRPISYPEWFWRSLN